MNKRTITGYLLTLFLTINYWQAQAQVGASSYSFTGYMPVGTGLNFTTQSGYVEGSEDAYWRIYNEGGGQIVPKVGNYDDDWFVVDTIPDYPANWIYAEEQLMGTYTYKFNFCIEAINDEYKSDEEVVLRGVISGDNTISKIKFDGTEIRDFSLVPPCTTTVTRERDYLCLKEFYVSVPDNLITVGYHVLSFEVENVTLDVQEFAELIPSTSGFFVGAILQGIDGMVLPFNPTGSTASCDRGEISGVVYNDLNSNHVRDVGEVGIGSITVQLWNSDSTYNSSTTTDETGFYSFNNVDEDNNYIVVSFLDGVTYTSDVYSISPVYYDITSFPEDHIVADRDFGFYDYPKQSCGGCIPSFLPFGGKKYLLSAWVKEAYNDNYPDTYKNSGIELSFNDNATVLEVMRPSGPIIDGWQRIEVEFTTPPTVGSMAVRLKNLDAPGEVFFDDIRIHPFKSNMQSFVYNPATQKLEAVLDENNYSTRYEYDDEGSLIRVKRETERGVKTIKEVRTNQSKIKGVN